MSLNLVKKVRKNNDFYAPSERTKKIYADEAETESNFKIDLSDTNTLRSYFNNICSTFENDIRVLTDVIKSQKQLIEYNAIYNAFVLEHISEEDFMEESEHYSYTPKDTDANELVDKLSCVLKYTGIKFSSSELAEIFQCKHENIEKALKRLPKNILTLIE